MPLPLLALLGVGVAGHYADEAMTRQQTKRANAFEQEASRQAALVRFDASQIPTTGTPEQQAFQARTNASRAMVENAGSPIKSIRDRAQSNLSSELADAASFARQQSTDPMVRAGKAEDSATAQAAVAQAKHQFEVTTGLAMGKDYRKEVAPFAQMTTMAQVAGEALMNMSAEDMKNPFKAMQIMRPYILQFDDSMITSDELSTVSAQQGLRQRLDSIMNQLTGGGEVTQETLAQIVESMNVVAQTVQGEGQRITSDWNMKATNVGTNPSYVTGGSRFNPNAVLTDISDALPKNDDTTTRLFDAGSDETDEGGRRRITLGPRT